jgi:aspartate kinase
MAQDFDYLVMTNLVVVKFGGSAIGPDGLSIPIIIQRINEIKKDSKIVAVFSAPLTIQDGATRSLTDVVLELGRNAEKNQSTSLDIVREAYEKILELVSSDYQEDCKNIINSYLEKSNQALEEAKQKGEFADETRSKALAFSGEILMSHVMNYIMKGQGIKSGAVDYENWPIMTDNNIESTNFLYSESLEKIDYLEKLVNENEVVTIGGFIGKTVDGITTTYERGGSDRSAADLAILLHKKFNTRIDFEKDSAVVSADPKIVVEGLSEVKQLSYNEARLAGMFGMKILDPIAIKEILENGVELPIIITNMKDPQKTTTILRNPTNENIHPLKIVTGKKNCAILRIETELAGRLVGSLDKEKRYSEFIILSPFTKDGIAFSRLLFLDGDYVKRNEKYLLGFDSLATITYNRGVITMIGDEMWRVQQIASKASAKIGEAGLNILNMDAQEETSRIIIVIEDSGDDISKAISAIHSEKSKVKFV